MTDMTHDGRAIEVADNPQGLAFEATVDGEVVGRAVYRLTDGVMVFTHTEVTPSEQGQGIADVLARRALDDVRDSGRQVVPQCPFISAFIHRHEEYADLVAPTR